MSSSLASAVATAVSSSVSASASSLVNKNKSSFKIVGICLAVGSGALIGSSFVVKKKGLLRATEKYGNQTGEGHGYLKSWLWWIGMIMMILGEICNFVAYAFTEAILVTPMGALSVVVCAIMSHFFLKESLNFFGWIGCSLCIIGAVILALNAPEQASSSTINEFKKFFISPGFLVWASICIIFSLVIVFWAAPRWGKTNMMPYILVCSLIGGISVSCTQGLGSSIVTSIQGDNQVKNWFFWFLFVFVVVTLLVEINYLNKALELFNAAMVVPVYFVIFTSATLITSFILYQGLKAAAVTLVTMVFGFLVICLGITLLQMSKVDPTTLTKLDRKATIFLEAAHHPTEEAEKGNVSAMEEPGMDALRGGFGTIGSIIRARSINRRMSTASSQYGKYGFSGNPNLSTHGMGHVQRFQLSDNPMPDDAMERVSLHAKSPVLEQSHSFPSSSISPKKSFSSLKNEEADVGHYSYANGKEHWHSPVHHSNNSHGGLHAHFAPQTRPSGMRQASGSTAMAYPYPPLMEDPEEYEHDGGEVQSAPPAGGEKAHSIVDLYLSPRSASRLDDSPSTRSSSPRSPSASRLASMFHFGHHGNDPQRGETRGGAHRGTKDYPHLKTKDYATEREERAALFSADNEEDDGGARAESVQDEDGEKNGKTLPRSRPGLQQSIEQIKTDPSEWLDVGKHGTRTSLEDEPKSAVTDDSLGHVLTAQVRPSLPPIITGPSAPPGGGGGGSGASAEDSTPPRVAGPRGPRDKR